MKLIKINKVLFDFIRQFITCGEDDCQGCDEDISAIIEVVRNATIKEVVELIDDRLKVLPEALVGEDYTPATYELNRLKELITNECFKRGVWDF